MELCFGRVFFVHAQLENVRGYAWFAGGKRQCWGRAGGTGRPARVGCGDGRAKPFRVTFVPAPRGVFWSHGCDVALHAFTDVCAIRNAPVPPSLLRHTRVSTPGGSQSTCCPRAGVQGQFLEKTMVGDARREGDLGMDAHECMPHGHTCGAHAGSPRTPTLPARRSHKPATPITTGKGPARYRSRRRLNCAKI